MIGGLLRAYLHDTTVLAATRYYYRVATIYAGQLFAMSEEESTVTGALAP